MRVSVLILASLWAAGALAQQQPPEDPIARSRRIIDEAMAQSAQAKTAKDRLEQRPHWGPSPADMRKMKGADPMAIAERYREAGVGQPKPTNALMIFISTSMPMKALTMLGTQAKQAGGILILRGLKGRLDKPGALKETIAALQSVAETGVDIQIDPKAFQQYDVTAVPTFVMASNEEGCRDEVCSAEAFRLVGDTTLAYALEHWVNQGGRAAVLAEQYLRKVTTE